MKYIVTQLPEGGGGNAPPRHHSARGYRPHYPRAKGHRQKEKATNACQGLGNDEKRASPTRLSRCGHRKVFIRQALSRTCLPDKTDKSTPFVVGCMRAGVKKALKLFTV